MSSRWETICAAVADDLVAVDPTLRFGYGALTLTEHRALNSIFFVPAGGQVIQPTLEDGGGRVDPGDSTGLTPVVFYAVQTLDVFLWANTTTVTEQMMHNVIVAFWDQAYGSVEFGEFSWMTQEEQESIGFDVHGQMIRLSVSLKIPVLRHLQPLHIIEGFDHSTEAYDEAGDLETVCTFATGPTGP